MANDTVQPTKTIQLTSLDQIMRLSTHPFPCFPVDEVVAITMDNGRGGVSTLGMIQKYTGECGGDHFREFDGDGTLQNGLDDPCRPEPILTDLLRKYGLTLPDSDD